MNLRAEKTSTLVLAGSCGVLLLLVLAFEFGLGRGYSWNADSADAASGASGDAVDRNAFKLAAADTYAEINARPLFNDDRKPTPPPPPIDATAADAPPPVAPLKIRLSGVMITRKTRVAMISDDRKNPPAVIKEGMPLPGDLGGWTLAKLNPRSAVFKGAGGENIELELDPGAQGQKPAAPVPGTPAPPGAPHPAQPAAAPVAPAPPPPPAFGPGPGAVSAKAPPGEELQRRIEERRKQIREQNDRLRQQAPQPQTPQQQQ